MPSCFLSLIINCFYYYYYYQLFFSLFSLSNQTSTSACKSMIFTDTFFFIFDCGFLGLCLHIMGYFFLFLFFWLKYNIFTTFFREIIFQKRKGCNLTKVSYLLLRRLPQIQMSNSLLTVLDQTTFIDASKIKN